MTQRGPILHVIFPTCEMAQRTMVRPQEFYESPIPGIRGEVFTFSQYVGYNSEANGGTYVYDWSGFNIPGPVLNEFFERFRPLSPNEALLQSVAQSLGDAEDYYFIGTCADDPDPDTLAHELCHARWYLDPAYKAGASARVDALKHYRADAFGAFRAWLLDRGYDESVLDDECNAYLSTTPRDWWASHEEGGGEGTPELADLMWDAGAELREFESVTRAHDVVRFKMPHN